MSATEAAEARPDSRKRRLGLGGCLTILGGVFALIVLIPTVAYLTWVNASAKRVERQLADLRATGQPTTAAELDAYYVYPPAGKDVTQLLLVAIQTLDSTAYQEAAKSVPIVGEGEANIPPLGTPWPEQEAAETLLADYAHVLDQLHEAAAKGGAARFPVQFEDGLSTLLPHAQQLRGAARLLTLEAYIRARQGDSQGAAQSIRDLLTLSRSLENEPLMVSQLVRFACQYMACQTLQDLLSQLEFSDEDLESLQQNLRRDDFQTAVRRALVGERTIGLVVMQSPAAFAEIEAVGNGPASRFGNRFEDLTLYIETMDQLIEATGLPWPEARQTSADIGEEVNRAVSESPVSRLRFKMTATLVPLTDVYVTAGAREDAVRRLADTAIAIERFRRVHGTPPQTLTDLIPDFLPTAPIDPFDGQPLRHVVRPGGIRIYSVGQDLTDDGGEGDLAGEPDIVWQLRPSPAPVSE